MNGILRNNAGPLEDRHVAAAQPALRGAQESWRILGILIVVPMFDWQEFLPVDGDISRSFDTEADFAPVDIYDGDTYVFTDVDLFPEFPREDEHCSAPLPEERAIPILDTA